MEQSNDESVSRTDVNTEYEYWEVEVPDTDSNRVHYLNAAAKFGWRLVQMEPEDTGRSVKYLIERRVK